MKRNTTLSPAAVAHLNQWVIEQPKLLKRIFRMFEECARTPFDGIGKPEPLKGNKQGFWSRRIDEARRLVYSITDSEITVVSLRGHYDE